MKALLATVAFVVSATGFAQTNMNLEGYCTGALADGAPVDFTYYSDFDGCKKDSTAAVVFAEGGLSTGKRSFKNGKDIYAFESAHIEFDDSTGNLGGTLKTAEGETVKVTCEIRDYEYASEC